MSASSDKPFLIVLIARNTEWSQETDLTFNYNIEFLCWDCYGEREGIMLRKSVGQIQSDLHFCKLGMSQ